MTTNDIHPAAHEQHAEILALFKQDKCNAGFGNIVYSAKAMYDKGWIVEARFEGTLVGAYCVRHCTNKSQTSLYFIAVDQAYRRHGVGTELLEHLKASAPSGRIVLGVNKDNEGARAFYLRHGFAETGECYQGKGVTMEWVL